MTRHSGHQQLVEARQIARDHGLLVIDVKASAGKTEHVVYRLIPGGQRIRLGKRATAEGLRAYVCKLASFH